VDTVGQEFACKVVMPDASAVEGYVESGAKKLKPDTVVQFERFGFVRLDEAAGSCCLLCSQIGDELGCVNRIKPLFGQRTLTRAKPEKKVEE
jgi:hypothetical protein